MKSKWFLVVAIALAVMLGLSVAMIGCKTTSTTTAAVETTVTATTTAAETTAVAETTAAATTLASGKNITIGSSYYDMSYNYFVLMDAGARNYCKSQGWTYINHDEKSSETTMVTGCEDLINQGINALLLSPFKPDAIGPIVDAAHAKKIPVIVLDIGTGGYPIDTFVISDCVGGGKMAAKYLIDYLNKKGITGSIDVALIRNDPSDVYAYSRGDGFVDIIKSTPGYNIVKDIAAQSATADASYPIAKSIITANPKLKAFFCTNDNMATGAAQAAIDSGRKDILVIGFDGQDIGLESVQKGTMLATVRQLPYNFGQIGCKVAGQLINGETVQFDDTANKTIYVPIDLIDSTNVAEAIAEINKELGK